MTTSSPSSPTPPKQTPTAPAAMVRKVSFSPDQFDSPSPLSPHPNSPTKRRSSMKQDAPRPVIPPKETYQHPDPLLRRLRLRDGWGKPVNLETEFRDAQVVAILFGATWPGSIQDPFRTVEDFAKRHPHRLKVIYCSCDTSEKTYEANTKGKPWLSMEWEDGSNLDTPSTTSTSPHLPLSSEPFLLATDPDLEGDLHSSDPTGSLYLRPYSRVFLAEKFQVLGVPSLAVYHLPKQEVLTNHARFESMKGEKGDATWAKWEAGERVDITFADVVSKLRWTLGLGAIAAAYFVAVRVGGVDDVVTALTEQLTRNYLGR